MRILAKNDRKSEISGTTHRVKTASIIFWGSFEPQKWWKQILKFGHFLAVLGPFLAFFTLFDICVIFSPYLVISEIFAIICNFLPFVAIFYHMCAFVGPFRGICIWMHFKAFKSIFSCFSPLYQFFEVVSSQKNDDFFFLNFAIFWLIFGIFLHVYHLFTIFSKFWNIKIICNFQAFFAIFYHFLVFVCPFWEIYI